MSNWIYFDMRRREVEGYETLSKIIDADTEALEFIYGQIEMWGDEGVFMECKDKIDEALAMRELLREGD